MLATALGCNLAWGLTDAVMYLIGAATENRRRIALLRRLHETSDARAAHGQIAAELPGNLADGLPEAALEAMRQRLLAVPMPRAGLHGRDYTAALGVFAIVVAVTFPVALPFLLVRGDVPTAMRLSNGLALATLYAFGHLLGRHTGGRPWTYGLAVAAIGVVLVAIIMALGG
jgi:VIT1/CCC1 family predicted Fe2+/Mn2+ transporter